MCFKFRCSNAHVSELEFERLFQAIIDNSVENSHGYYKEKVRIIE